MNRSEQQQSQVLASVGSVDVGGYDVILCPDLLRIGNPVLEQAIHGRRCLFVVSPTVERLYGRQLKEYIKACGIRSAGTVVLPSGEGNKSLESVSRLCGAAVESQLGRRDLVIGIGGGTLLDVAGFTAGMFRRGVPHMRIGTTLLAQVDASVGVKCGINYCGKKNLLGLFEPPDCVLLDPHFLDTLPRRQVSTGLAEVIKLGVVYDKGLLTKVDNWSTAADPHARLDLLQVIVGSAARAMANLLDINLLERELRRRADFGHIVSPRLEMTSRTDLNHGEAVAIDLALSSLIAYRLHFLSEADAISVVRLEQAVGLRVWHEDLTEECWASAIAESRRHRDGTCLPFPDPLGGCTFVTDTTQITNADVKWSIETLKDLDGAGAEVRSS